MVPRVAPLLPVAGAFAAGLALAPWVPLAGAWAGWLVAVSASVVGLALGRPALSAAALLVAVVATGALRAAPLPAPPDDVARLELPARAHVEGRLGADPRRLAPEAARLVLDVERVDGRRRQGRVQLTVRGPLPPLARGQRLAVDARLHRAVGFRNPGVFDYAAHLAREGIRVVGAVPAERVLALEPAAPAWPARLRRRAIAAMGEALPPVSAALLAGLLLGERGDLPADVQDAFRRAGVYHVLAVSGFNVALVAAAAWGLLATLRAPPRVAWAGAIAAVAAYAAIVGPEPSVLRATVMAVLVLAALLLEREAAVVNGLALAALVILALRPGDLADPGFQLSFAATLGIVLAPRPRHVVAGALAVSLAAQAAVTPITLAHFNQLSLIGPLANLAAVPLAALATVVGLVAVLLGFASDGAGATLLAGTWPSLLLLRWTAALAAAVPGAVVHLPAPGPAASLAYAAGLAAALGAWRLAATDRRRARRLGAAAAALLGAALVLGAWPLLRPADGRLRLTVLDVGQGDAIVIESPDGRVALVDAGPGGPYRPDAGARVIAPYLWNRGVLALDAVLLTHADADHAGGAPSLLRRVPAALRWDRERLARGPVFLGPVMLTLVSPAARAVDEAPPSPAPPWPGARRRNDEAIVVRVEWRLASFLLASDIEAPAEHALVASGRPLAATVLKVAHHGARTSTTPGFVAAVRPTLAVVSVGARNAYGHPDPGTLARLRAVGARVYRTDRDGAVILETDGRILEVTRWAAGARERVCLDPEAIC
jgi:competence protein ComEC